MDCANLATFLKNTAADEQITLSGRIGRAKLLLQANGYKVDFKLTVLDCGSCEALKLGVHAATFGLAVVMSAYNAAAWFRRREQHLAVNAALYAALIALEHHHVAHHFALLRQRPRELQ
ncbi:MAG TPA: hypothetical protein VGJ39_00405 [Vicinamibacterales bacterium]